MRTSRAGAGLGVGLLVTVACGRAPGVDGPVELGFAARIEPTGYTVEYEQDIEWGSANLERRYGAHYVLGTDDGSQGSVRLESMRVRLSTPHGQQTVDTRHLAGSEFRLTVGLRGGRPGYPDEVPVLEMPGMLEGRVPLSRLLDFGFPDLPDASVEVGHRWTARSSHPHVEAHVTATAHTTTAYHFSGWDTVDGVDCARIEGRLTGDVVSPPTDVHGATVEFNGALDGRLEWCFDPRLGALVEMSGETSSDGTLTAAGNATPIKQITRVRIARPVYEP